MHLPDVRSGVANWQGGEPRSKLATSARRLDVHKVRHRLAGRVSTDIPSVPSHHHELHVARPSMILVAEIDGIPAQIHRS